MRVLHIIQRYWPATGGAEAHLGEISARLAAEGHQVTVATTDALDFELFWNPRAGRMTRDSDVHEDVQILRFPVRHLPGSPSSYAAVRRLLWCLSIAQPVPVGVLTRLAQFTPRVPGLWRWSRRSGQSFDVVAGMTVCFEPLLYAGLELARRQHVPFLVYPLTHLGAGNKPGADRLSRFYTMRHQVAVVNVSDAVVCQTAAERDFYLGRGISAERMLVAGPGIEPSRVLGGNSERFRTRHHLSGPIVVALGTMSADKGTVHLVEAVRTLRRDGYRLDLVLAGTVTASFQAFLAGLPGQERDGICFLGPIAEDEKKDLLAAADVLAMPSRADSFGIVYLEAWVCGKPVIGAKTWGINNVIEEGRDGLLVPFGDIPSLAYAIRFLLDHPDERTAMGLAGRNKVYEAHTWTHKYALIRDLYCRLASHRR